MVRHALIAVMLTVAPAGIARSSDPLPLDVALSLRGHNGRSPVNLSPDGAWVAHTIEAVDTVRRGASRSYSASGFPFAEGNSRMEATLSSLRGDDAVRIGAEDASSWAPVWSPDGRRVAFYSDQGGEAGLWVWERTSGARRRVGDFVARPMFGFEGARWTPDGERIVVKVLPRELSLEEANALLPARRREAEPEEPVAADEPSVVVRRSSALIERETTDAGGGEAPSDSAPSNDPAMAFIRGNAVDLAMVDVTTGALDRIVDRETVRWVQVAPNGDALAYCVLTGFVPTAQQGLFELRHHDLSTGETRVLARDIKLAYGIEWSWSPDSKSLAYMESGQQGSGRFVLLDVETGDSRTFEGSPSFDPGDGEVPPIWSADGRRLFGVAEGALWSVEVETGVAESLAAIDGWSVRMLVQPSWYEARPFSTDAGRTLWVAAVEREGGRRGLFAIDQRSGEGRLEHAEEGTWSFVFSTAASPATGDVVYVTSNQQQVGELWAKSVRGDAGARQVSAINADLGRYQLGEARLLEWRSTAGEPLRGALLLPPGAAEGQRHPLVVWVYGGAMGSGSLHRFGLWGSMATFNMHLLATRGYAVLYPDAPLRTGHTTEDLVATVLPGVNAAIDQGWADPERLALMGQSYGSLNVLALLTRTERFGAAVITAAVLHPDLAADYLGSIGYYEEGQGNMGGSLWEHPERYLRNSPLFDFPAITTPILIGQGDQDGDGGPSEAIFAALERLEKEVELRVYEGESHVISRPANVRDFWQRRLEFLAHRLGLEIGEDGRVHVP